MAHILLAGEQAVERMLPLSGMPALMYRDPTPTRPDRFVLHLRLKVLLRDYEAMTRSARLGHFARFGVVGVYPTRVELIKTRTGIFRILSIRVPTTAPAPRAMPAPSCDHWLFWGCQGQIRLPKRHPNIFGRDHTLTLAAMH